MRVMVMEELCEKLVEVSDRVMEVVLVFEEELLILICGYAPLRGRILEEKQSICDEAKGELDMHTAGVLVMCLGDFNGHVGMYIDGWYCVSQRNLKEEGY